MSPPTLGRDHKTTLMKANTITMMIRGYAHHKKPEVIDMVRYIANVEDSNARRSPAFTDKVLRESVALHSRPLQYQADHNSFACAAHNPPRTIMSRPLVTL